MAEDRSRKVAVPEEGVRQVRLCEIDFTKVTFFENRLLEIESEEG